MKLHARTLSAAPSPCRDDLMVEVLRRLDWATGDPFERDGAPRGTPSPVVMRWVDLRATDQAVERAIRVLPDVERRYADRGTPVVRRQRVLVRAAARELLAAELNMAPREVPLTATADGRPEVEASGFDVSWSHAEDVAVVVVGRGVRVGVDIEPLSRIDGRKVATEAVRTAGCRETSQQWTCLEAAWKLTGDGLRGLTSRSGHGSASTLGVPIPAPPGYAAALATADLCRTHHPGCGPSPTERGTRMSALSPETTTTTPLAEFRSRFAASLPVHPRTAEQLHRASVEHSDSFWRTLLDWAELPWSGSPEPVRTGAAIESARFFPGLQLNYAEALLATHRDLDDEPAITAIGADGHAETRTRRELRECVADRAARLLAVGVTPADRVVLLGGNALDTAIAGLSVTAVGAALSTAPLDLGPLALVGRLAQVEPSILAVVRPQAGSADRLIAEVVAEVPSITRVILLDDQPAPELSRPVETVRLTEVEPQASDVRLGGDWPRRPFDHPLFVMFTSGTTGPPKAMVHGIGGTLLEHVKEHRLHCDLRPGDTLFFHTTTAWMMWNWQLSALASGVHVVVHEGPVTDPRRLWEVVERVGATHFGTSPAHLQLTQESGLQPGTSLDLSRLRSILSTGAVLHDWQFDWLAAAVGDQQVQSISGGTDLLGCLLAGHPELPVRRGRLQSRSLGIDVVAVDAAGNEVVDAPGDLVIRRPFPSRPVRFLKDPDGQRFHEAYFVEHPGMWTHGDLVEFAEDGSARVLGRVDGVLNIDGVRIGPGEVTAALRGIEELADSMAVEQPDPGQPGRSRMVLLVVPRTGGSVDDDLERRIRRTLREEASPAHVPAVVLAVPGLPVTHNGKRSDAAARVALDGQTPRNLSALRNPDVVAQIAEAARAHAQLATQSPDPIPGSAEAPIERPVVVPDAALRTQLAALWCDVLGVSDVRDDDHYADRGGASRQLVGLLRRIRLDLGREVPIDDVLADPTFAGLVRATAAAVPGEMDGIVPLRDGIGRPIYMTVDAWGQLHALSRLTEGLDTDRPIIGIRPHVTHDGRQRLTEDVGRDIVELLVDFQPEGPFTLVGYSYGGVLFYEAAQQLQARGREVAFLGIVDSFPPKASMTRGVNLARSAAGRIKAFDGLGHVVRWVRQRVQPQVLSPEDRVWHAGKKIYDLYKLQPYTGVVTYFRAIDDLPFVGSNMSVWRQAVEKLVVTDVPGDHMSLLSNRFVGPLAERLSVLLR